MHYLFGVLHDVFCVSLTWLITINCRNKLQLFLVFLSDCDSLFQKGLDNVRAVKYHACIAVSPALLRLINEHKCTYDIYLKKGQNLKCGHKKVRSHCLVAGIFRTTYWFVWLSYRLHFRSVSFRQHLSTLLYACIDLSVQLLSHAVINMYFTLCK